MVKVWRTMYKACLNLNRSCKVLARERRQTEEFQHYEEQEEWPRDSWFKVETKFVLCCFEYVIQL